MRKLLIAIVIVSFFVCQKSFGQNEPRIKGIYSNYEYQEDSGDLIGLGVIILSSSDGMSDKYYALVQFVEGVPEKPQLVDLQVNKNEVEFSTRDSNGKVEITFRGKVTKDALVGKIVQNGDKYRLKRVNKLWGIGSD